MTKSLFSRLIVLLLSAPLVVDSIGKGEKRVSKRTGLPGKMANFNFFVSSSLLFKLFLTGLLPILPFPSLPFGNLSSREPIDPPSDRIFRGWELDPHEFPWMVKLMVRNNIFKFFFNGEKISFTCLNELIDFNYLG